MKSNVTVTLDIKMQAWAIPSPGMDLDGFVQKMKDIGNQVLEVDRVGNRVLIGKVD